MMMALTDTHDFRASEELEQVEQWSVYAHILSDDLMLSSADAQLIFTLAYGTAFYSI